MEKEENQKAVKIEESPAFRHSVPVQMRFNDVDMLGHVNNTMCMSYYDLGKTAYFTTVRKGLMEWNKTDVVIANINCNFYSPIYFGEPISVVTRVESIHEKSFKMHQRIVNTVTKEIKGECATVMVSFDPMLQCSKKLSDIWVKALCDYEGRNLLKPASGGDETK